MKPLALAIVMAVGIGGAACDRSKSEPPASGKIGDNKLVNPRTTMVRGCLTGSSDQFVLTSLERSATGANNTDRQPAPAESVAATASYRLVGMSDQLKGLVGQRVEVSGDSEPDQVVDLVSATPANPPVSQPGNAPSGGAVGTAGNDPKVSTASRARVEIHDLRVQSVTALGEKCAGS
jgi:hypothetical protein